MKEDADADVKKGKDHDSKAKALMMARVIVAANDKIDTPIPGLMVELAPLKAMKGVEDFKAEGNGNGKFEIYLIGSKFKVGKYDIKNPKQAYAVIKNEFGHEMTPAEMRELENTINRIKSKNPRYSNDGTEYKNSYLVDPESQILDTGHTYKEWTVKTPGVGTNGQRRIVVNNQTGEAYYSHNHYKKFVKMNLSAWK
jgi:guanyl-specific ribonuclease Sa